MTTRETHLEGYALDRYEVLEYVATGGFAEVYRGRDMQTGSEVALKVLKPSQAQKTEAVARFRDEAMHTSQFHRTGRHPNIIEVHYVGECSGYHYMAMPFLHGETLEQRLNRGPLPPDEVARVIGCVGAALDHAHTEHAGNRRVHRDVKPSNVFLLSNGGVVLMDFGLVREQKGLDITATQTIIGTPQYMSPEQIKGLGISFKSDIYALAHVAYEALSGRPAFPNTGDQFGVMWSQVNNQPPPIQIAGLPASHVQKVDTVLRRALEKDPAKRHDTAGKFAASLGDAIIGRMPPEGPTSPKRLPIFVAAAGLFLLSALAYTFLDDDGRPRPTPVPPNATRATLAPDPTSGGSADTPEPAPTDEPPADTPEPEPTDTAIPPLPTGRASGTLGVDGSHNTFIGARVVPHARIDLAMTMKPCRDDVNFSIELTLLGVVDRVEEGKHDGACRVTSVFDSGNNDGARIIVSSPPSAPPVRFEFEASGLTFNTTPPLP